LVLTVNKHSLLEQNHVDIIDEEELVYNSSTHSMLLHPSTTADHKSNDASDHNSMRIVGCGYPGRGEDVSVIIVSTQNEDEVSSNGSGTVRALPDLEVGEIWVDSPSKAQGYWEQPQLSHHDFQAQLIDTSMKSSEEELSRRYLRTGDRGFMYKGELFICGRSKDMIILGGANHYPQDIERSIEQGIGEHLRAGCSAAIALHTNQIMESINKSSKGNKLQSLLHSNTSGEIVVYMAEVSEDDFIYIIRVLLTLYFFSLD
jgi:acyl-CoA synthetase (AMP-forming)/AMP-acid ligase II